MFFLSFTGQHKAQTPEWNNSGCNWGKNGFINVAGPTTDSILWQASSAGIFGTPIFIEGNYLVTMRFQSTTYAPVECYNLTNGNLIWTVDVTNSTGRSLPVGLRDNKVYVVLYTESLNDTLYALDVSNGSKVWTSDVNVAPYITETGVFDSTGYFYINGNQKTYKIDPTNGQMIWQATTIPMASGSGEMAINQTNNTGYTLEQNGGISYLWAIDLNNGQKKYSQVINQLQLGGNLPQSALMVGTNGTIYVQLTQDNIAAIRDNGTQLNVLWQTKILGNSSFSLMCVGSDGSIYAPTDGKIVRLDPSTGDTLNISQSISQGGFYSPRITATNNNIIYATNGENYVYAFDKSLNLLWSNYIQGTNTSGVSVSQNGLAAVAGQNSIRVYTPIQSTGIKETDRITLEVYPNPTFSTINITCEHKFIGKEFVLTDTRGSEIKTGALSKNTSVDIENLPSGLYYLNVPGNKQTIKIVKY